MEIIRIPRIMQDIAGKHRMHGRTIGFVPTMGALHEGHLSLIRMSREENDITVVSIFVNPTQFGPSEDLARYPRDVERDTEKLRKEDIDILFLPDDSLMYPEGYCTYVEVTGLSERLCGAFRPGHFRGVATIIAKLFSIVSPVRAYFGQKDFQQVLIIKRLVKDLNIPVDIVACPTVREADGLAMSSRNLYLGPEERRAARAIYLCLTRASDAIRSGIINVSELNKMMMDILRAEPMISEIQYCSIYDPESLSELEVVESEALVALAIKIGGTRLIDSMLVKRGVK